MLPVINRKLFPTRKFHYKRKDGLYHIGTDISCYIGDKCEVRDEGIAVFNGIIEGFGSDGAKGGVVIIQHPGYVALYGHVTGTVEKGHLVKKGDVIGKVHEYCVNEMDLTHLHLVVRWGNGWPLGEKMGYAGFKELKKYTDPEKFFTFLEEI
jgi:hypothetical protein